MRVLLSDRAWFVLAGVCTHEWHLGPAIAVFKGPFADEGVKSKTGFIYIA